MNKRLRKKKRVGEFKEFGFKLFADLRSCISDDDIEAFVDRLIVFVQTGKLAFGGGGGRDGKFEGSWDAATPPRTTALRWPPSSRATTPWFVTRYWSFETRGTGGTSGMTFFSKLKAAFTEGPATSSTTAAPAPVARGPSWRASDATGSTQPVSGGEAQPTPGSPTGATQGGNTSILRSVSPTPTTSGSSEPPSGTEIAGFHWSREISPQKWMNLYTKVLALRDRRRPEAHRLGRRRAAWRDDFLEGGGDEGGLHKLGLSEDIDLKPRGGGRS